MRYWTIGLLATVLAGCGEPADVAGSTRGPAGPHDSAPEVSPAAPGEDDAGGSFAIGEGGSSPSSNCAKESRFVYVIDAFGTLIRFDPPTLAMATIGIIGCGTSWSMSVARDATAWVVLNDGQLAKVDTRDASCVTTGFVARQGGFPGTFGMGFVSDSNGGNSETLFVSGHAGTTSTLAKIDTSSLALKQVAPYDKMQAYAELSGTGDGRLFAMFMGSPFVLAQIDKSSAKVISQTPLPGVNASGGGAANFAFAFWGGDFYIFVGPGNTRTDVFRHRPSDKTTTKLTSVTTRIVGAGVSTCAPTAPPK